LANCSSVTLCRGTQPEEQAPERWIAKKWWDPRADFFGERSWKRIQQGHYDLAQEHFNELRYENKLRLVELLLTELQTSEQRGIALDYVMNLTGHPEPESFDDIRKGSRITSRGAASQIVRQRHTQEDRDRDAWAASMDRADVRRNSLALKQKT
jgi:hypothetical protein